MYLPRGAILDCERRFGLPRAVALEAEMTPAETDRLVASQRRGRAHDVTFFIIDAAERVVVIRKPDFPHGCWRPPSGGVEPGEGIEAGAVREAREETGLDVALERYLVRIDGRFVERVAEGPGRVVPWTSHVFTARVKGGRLAPIDTREIAEARWAALAELAGPIRAALLAAGRGGFRYRVGLHDAVLDALGQRFASGEVETPSATGRTGEGPRPAAR